MSTRHRTPGKLRKSKSNIRKWLNDYNDTCCDVHLPRPPISSLRGCHNARQADRHDLHLPPAGRVFTAPHRRHRSKRWPEHRGVALEADVSVETAAAALSSSATVVGAVFGANASGGGALIVIANHGHGELAPKIGRYRRRHRRRANLALYLLASDRVRLLRCGGI